MFNSLNLIWDKLLVKAIHSHVCKFPVYKRFKHGYNQVVEKMVFKVLFFFWFLKNKKNSKGRIFVFMVFWIFDFFV